MNQKSLLTLTVFFLSVSSAFAGADAGPSLSLSSLVKKALAEKFNNSEIQFSSLRDVEKSLLEKQFGEIKTVRLIETKPNGIAVLEVAGLSVDGEHEESQVIQTPFEAWMNVPVAIRRIYPNTKLKDEDFKTTAVNVASGNALQYRGVMVSAETDFSRMESAQSILEGQFVVSNAIRKQPDIRKGETVKLQLNSGELSLVTQAVVQEPASIGDQVHVLTIKSKRDIVGKVMADRSVEVSL